MGNETWISQNYPLLIIVVAIVGIVIFGYFWQRRKKGTPPPQPQGSVTKQPAQPATNKPKQTSAPAPQANPAPSSQQTPAAKPGFGLGIFNGVPVAISKDTGKPNGWSVQSLKYKDYAQSSDEVGKLASQLAVKLRDYENLRALMSASREALNLLVQADLDSLAPTIDKLQSAIERVEGSEAAKEK